MNDYDELKKIFPRNRDWFHINGKFMLRLPVRDGEWLVGELKGELLKAAGFRWEILNGKLIIYDRQ